MYHVDIKFESDITHVSCSLKSLGRADSNFISGGGMDKARLKGHLEACNLIRRRFLKDGVSCCIEGEEVWDVGAAVGARVEEFRKLCCEARGKQS